MKLKNRFVLDYVLLVVSSFFSAYIFDIVNEGFAVDIFLASCFLFGSIFSYLIIKNKLIKGIWMFLLFFFFAIFIDEKVFDLSGCDDAQCGLVFLLSPIFFIFVMILSLAVRLCESLFEKLKKRDK